jgi:hypothetical protein
MSVRTTTRSVTFRRPFSLTFRRPFSLKGADGLQPAGTYVVETEEEAIPALSFRRLSTTMTLSTRYGEALSCGRWWRSIQRSSKRLRRETKTEHDRRAYCDLAATGWSALCIGSVRAGTIDHCR